MDVRSVARESSFRVGISNYYLPLVVSEGIAGEGGVERGGGGG